MFESVQPGQVDPMFELKKRADSDHSPQKVDLGVGIYRNELGEYHELRCLRKAKQRLAAINPAHDYELTIGNASFLEHAARLMFGENCEALAAHIIASVQTISGTGANHLGALFLARCANRPRPKVYIGAPAWGNYDPLFQLVGLDIVHYNHYDQSRGGVDFEACLEAVRTAPRGSVFVLQGCCHNPTGADFDREQWKILAREMKSAGHLPFFDIAYQGLGEGPADDAFAIRHFAQIGFEMLVCQSFSKNLGLYGERVGALHVVTRNHNIAANVQDQLRNLIRWEFSSSPAYGSRLANLILEDKQETEDWLNELGEIRERLRRNRASLSHMLRNALKTPGDWSHIQLEKGLFSFLNLTPMQSRLLIERYQIYLPSNGRINISGLNETNVERVALAIDAVVREDLGVGITSRVSSVPRVGEEDERGQKSPISRL